MADNVSTIEGSPVYTLFDTEQAQRLNAGHITRLAAGVLGAVRIPGLFTPGQCAAIMRGLEACEMSSYDEQLVSPRISKLGPAAYDFYGARKLQDEYWAHAEAATTARSKLLDGNDPLDFAISWLGQAWGGEVRAAKSGGMEMFAGMIREINAGARIHFDELAREFSGAIDELPISQLAFNCHLATPAAGGEAVVYRRRWQPSDEAHRDGYGYAQSLVAGQPQAAVAAGTGDVTMFDSRNYHEVRPNAGAGRRVTLSFFVGISGRGHLLIWS
jgi:L-gamma-glutamyl-L-propargylglycine hydroxylase